MRLYAATFAVMLALQSIWLLLPELVRPALPFFLTSTEQATTASSKQSAAATAARLGWPRGELWVDYAQTANSSLLAAFYSGTKQLEGGNDKVPESAVTIAPTDARGWLLLATAKQSLASGTAKLSEQLKISYYLTPFSESLFPLRIQLVARSSATIDDELRGFIENELSKWLSVQPAMPRPLNLAYSNASAAGRVLLDTLIGKTSPALLEDLHTVYP
jgi:hypothetical protein